MRILFLSGLMILSSVFVFSQEEEKKLPKFGKVSQEEMMMTVCPIDTGAHAFYIFDKGNTDFVPNNYGFRIKFTRHLRIKILNKSASDVGNFEIPLPEDGTQLMELKGYTYNYVNGKIEKTKLKSNQIIVEKKDEYLTIKKFALADVREGSVIEVYYEILGYPFFSMEWRFQSEIPSLYCEYKISIPQYFTYNCTTYGYYPLKAIKYTNNIGENRTKYYLSDIPAFKEGAFLRTPDNYISRIKFELAGVMFGGFVNNQSFSHNWEDVNKQLLEHSYFGEVLSKTGFLNDEVKTLKEKKLSEKEMMTAAYEQIKKRMKWNNINSLTAT